MPVKRLPGKQLLLDGFAAAETEPIVDGKVEYNKMHVSRATFMGGLSSPVHRWFRLTPSFGPELVREILSELDAGGEDVVIDPFCGAGTTLIECQLAGIPSFGFEINPFLHFVADTSLFWQLDPAELESTLARIERDYREQLSGVTWENLGAKGLSVPPIHNPARWWREDVMLRLLVLKRAISGCSESKHDVAFFRLALCGVLVPDLTNVTLGRLQLHFIDKSGAEMNVFEIFQNHASEMIIDLRSLHALRPEVAARVYLEDATQLDGVNRAQKASLVVTSPPYPNRYSYVWNTRPYLYLFEFMSTPKEASQLDMKTIGGTWGTATSILQKGVIEAANPAVAQAVLPVAEQVRKQDNLMANYLVKYFNDLSKQILEMERVLQRRASIAYVVGCSRLKEVYVETDVLLARIIESLGLGYVVKNIRRIRKRHSGKDLHESIVFASRRGP